MKTLEFNRNRKSIPQCPCGRSNSNGKFASFEGYEDKGYCFCCMKTFLPVGKIKMPDILPVYGTKEREVSFISEEIVRESMQNYTRNIFYHWLVELFGEDTAEEVCKKYKIGSSDHWEKRGATIFWYCDSKGAYRSGKIMLYSTDGHRVKKPYDHCNWVHAVSKLSNFHLSQCFFGEHLLSKPENADKPVVLVESEKTSIIASIYFPDVIWLACGGASGLTEAKCRILRGRNVVLYPDLGKLSLWSDKAEDLRKICASVKVSDYLERHASEVDRQGGFDIADYLIQFPVGEVVGVENESEEVSRQEPIRSCSSQLDPNLGFYEFPEFELPEKFKEYERFVGVEL
ncbi:MAG: hypothetical protein IPM69_03525 [Ignavibacteria bacterium]|nr:hypothetical protein [Ignavibacteria bacterium]